VAIIATGLMTAEALKARDLLKAEGIDAGVINMSTIKPIDAAAIVAAAKRCGAVVTAEEHSIIGGLGGAVAEVLSESQPAPLVRVGIKDTFGTSGEERRTAQALRAVAGRPVRCCEGSDQEKAMILISDCGFRIAE
jgi:transketolase